jgi:hypothetical protein
MGGCGSYQSWLDNAFFCVVVEADSSGEMSQSCMVRDLLQHAACVVEHISA